MESRPFSHLHCRALSPPTRSSEELPLPRQPECLQARSVRTAEENAPKRDGGGWAGTVPSHYCLHPKLDVIRRRAESSPQAQGSLSENVVAGKASLILPYSLNVHSHGCFSFLWT